MKVMRPNSIREKAGQYRLPRSILKVVINYTADNFSDFFPFLRFFTIKKKPVTGKHGIVLIFKVFIKKIINNFLVTTRELRHYFPTPRVIKNVINRVLHSYILAHYTMQTSNINLIKLGTYG